MPNTLARRIAGTLVRPRMAMSAALGVIAGVVLALTVSWQWPTVLLAAWNVGVGTHLALTFHMMATSDAARTLRRARRLDETALVILVISILAASASLLAIVLELAVVKDLGGLAKAGHVALAALTVFSAWTFIQTSFAVHYAHSWAIAADSGLPQCMNIPGEHAPDYWDFLYVSVSVGTSGQTADVEFTSKAQRRIGTAHAALAFFFNATVLALTINIAAGLI